jgi:hypothetical protein
VPVDAKAVPAFRTSGTLHWRLNRGGKGEGQGAEIKRRTCRTGRAVAGTASRPSCRVLCRWRILRRLIRPIEQRQPSGARLRLYFVQPG